MLLAQRRLKNKRGPALTFDMTGNGCAGRIKFSGKARAHRREILFQPVFNF